MWSAISQSFTIDYELVASVVEFIAGEEGADGEQSKEPDHGNDEDAGRMTAQFLVSTVFISNSSSSMYYYYNRERVRRRSDDDKHN